MIDSTKASTGEVGILLTATAIAGLSRECQDEIFALLRMPLSEQEPGEVLDVAVAAPDDALPERPGGVGPILLSERQLRQVWLGVNEYAQDVLRQIALSPNATFSLPVIASGAGITVQRQGPVLGGITRRVRALLKDKAKLLEVFDYTRDSEGQWQATIHATTHRNLRSMLAT